MKLQRIEFRYGLQNVITSIRWPSTSFHGTSTQSSELRGCWMTKHWDEFRFSQSIIADEQFNFYTPPKMKLCMKIIQYQRDCVVWVEIDMERVVPVGSNKLSASYEIIVSRDKWSITQWSQQQDRLSESAFHPNGCSAGWRCKQIKSIVYWSLVGWVFSQVFLARHSAGVRIPACSVCKPNIFHKFNNKNVFTSISSQLLICLPSLLTASHVNEEL